MRCKIRIFVVAVIVHVVVIFLIWSLLKNSDFLDQPRILAFAGRDPRANKSQSEFNPISCVINGEYNITCRRVSDEVYLPFTFIKKYFDVYGKIVKKNDVEIFNWSHSYATVHIPKKKYDPRGLFTHFQSYKVEERERVKCISASKGVPISTQWDANGYFYPTQIAQFGLSHYSKNLIEPMPISYVLEDGQVNFAPWIVPFDAQITRIPNAESKSIATCFKSRIEPISLKINVSLPILSLNLNLKSDDSRLVIKTINIYDKQIYYVHFTCEKQHIVMSDNNIRYGLFCDDYTKWYKLSRDAVIDILKGIMLKTKLKPKITKSSFQMDSIFLYGEGCIDDLTLLSNDHMTHFKLAVDWFVQNQDNSTGGWPNLVTRKMAGSLILKPGWYSAMGQGHALSVLARAYYLEKDEKYLKIASKALNPFKITSQNNGLKAMFLDEVPWYEEYPTSTPIFVLNGFIYALIGLYDFHTLAPSEYSKEAKELYDEGMISLKKLLMAFDTGSGSTYDLRHITLGIAPKLARWDYHATHISQLYLLTTIDKDPIFLTTAKRWLGYMNGKRASHN